MPDKIAGIHHITAIATDPQRNVDFYAGVLGLRLVKRTVNFDDPGTYHFYYGDRLGRPGTILTFFPWPLARRGSRGSGQVTTTAFSVAESSIGYWQARLREHGVVAEEPGERFDELVLAFYDPDGLKLELVADGGQRGIEPWDGGSVPTEHAIHGFHGATLAVREIEASASLLTDTMGLGGAGESGRRHRFEAAGDGAGLRVDLLHTPDESYGRIAAGSVHHIAWRVDDEEAQAVWRERIVDSGLQPTPILDRQYYKSIYFREPGGALFEFATDPPGFTLDEEPDELGTHLKLPPWLEGGRERIESSLPPITEPAPTGAGS